MRLVYLHSIFLSVTFPSRLCVFELGLSWTFSTKHLIGFRDSPQAGKPTGFCCVVLQAATSSECEEIVNRIGECETTSVNVIKGLICQASINLEVIHKYFPPTAAGFKHTEWFVWKTQNLSGLDIFCSLHHVFFFLTLSVLSYILMYYYNNIDYCLYWYIWQIKPYCNTLYLCHVVLIEIHEILGFHAFITLSLL